jgi:hypothetical protein
VAHKVDSLDRSAGKNIDVIWSALSVEVLPKLEVMGSLVDSCHASAAHTAETSPPQLAHYGNRWGKSQDKCPPPLCFTLR